MFGIGMNNKIDVYLVNYREYLYDKIEENKQKRRVCAQRTIQREIHKQRIETLKDVLAQFNHIHAQIRQSLKVR